MFRPAPFEKLVAALNRLPSVGRRSAERMAMSLVRDGGETAQALIEALEETRREIALCETCGSLTLTARNPCRFCTDDQRDGRLLCVVGDPADVLRIEQSGSFHGRYHVLPALLSPMRGEGVREVRAGRLVERIRSESIREVILALNTDVENDATASFLLDMLARSDVRVTRLACGLPAGSGVAYADSVTLARALDGRR